MCVSAEASDLAGSGGGFRAQDLIPLLAEVINVDIYILFTGSV